MSQENRDKLHASLSVQGDGAQAGTIVHMQGIVAASVQYQGPTIAPDPQRVRFELTDPLPEDEQVIGVQAFMDDNTPLMCAVRFIDPTTREVLLNTPVGGAGTPPAAPHQFDVTIYRRHPLGG